MPIACGQPKAGLYQWTPPEHGVPVVHPWASAMACTVTGDVTAVLVDGKKAGSSEGTYVVPSGSAVTVKGDGLAWSWLPVSP